MSTPERPPEPWHSFFVELDKEATSTIRVVCIGGFVVTQYYGLLRPTADVDYIELFSPGPVDALLERARIGGELHGKYGLYLSQVTVAKYPDSYDSRLREMFPGVYQHLCLLAFDPHDLALTKLERNSPKDRDDVRYLAKIGVLDLNVLQARYREEMRWQLGLPEREDLTLKLWMEIIREDRRSFQ